MSIEDEAKEFVKLIRAQDVTDRLLIDEPAAVQLIATALRVAEGRGYINGMDHMGAIADKAFAKVA